MTNQDRIKKYLVGDKGYLKSDISNGKVIMLSGKWGSGKTHFWQNEIATDKLKQELKDKREVYSYVSLYGKTSIEEIENDIFSQAYSSAIGGENFVTKGFSTFTKRMKRFGSSKIANGLKEEQNDNIERTALSRLNNGGILCFDDFERKSKDIDLNDLFGFITQLTLNFKCKVVIILNDDVFEGEDKNIFKTVKEKTVSKFLKYEPSIKDLFKSIIFEREDTHKFKYSKLRKYIKNILNTIEEVEELNARMYIQILDNVLEWIANNKTEKKDEILRCLILVNISFLNIHMVLKFNEEKKGFFRIPQNFTEYKDFPIFIMRTFHNNLESFSNSIDSKFGLINLMNQMAESEYTRTEKPNDRNEIKPTENLIEDLKKVNFYADLFWCYWKMDIILEYRKNISIVDLNKINNFIETGILIDE